MESSAAGFSPSAIVTACMKPDHVIMSRFYVDVEANKVVFTHIIRKKVIQILFLEIQ